MMKSISRKRDFALNCSPKKYLAMIAAIALLLGVVASSCALAAAQTVRTTRIKLSPSGTIRLRAGEQITVKAILKPRNSTQKVRWSSSSKKVATVKNGVVTARSKGMATITAKSGTKEDSVKVKVSRANAPQPTVTPPEPTTGVPESTFLRMSINGTAVSVEWENNASVASLMELAKNGLAIQMSMYGGFEQVGALGTGLPRDDHQITTQAGDIVLYSGNQIVVFYGSNTWAYTRLGHITDKSAEEMAALLGNGDVTITIAMSEE